MCENSELQVQPILNNWETAFPADVFELHYDADGLTIRVEPEVDGLTVMFKAVSGFRLLDEGDLLDWWSEFEHQPKTWVYQVLRGGWFEQESLSSGGFLSQYNTSPHLAEFLVVTENDCVNVMAFESPKLKLAG